MKRLFIGLITAALMSVGLVGVSSATANAATCPYTGCVKTHTNVHAPKTVKQNRKAQICVRVTTNGNGAPKGHVGLRVTRKTGGYRLVDAKPYNGRTCFKTTPLKKTGKYIVRATFEGKGAYRDSDDLTAFRVVKR
jgi:hypothetical protein